MRTISFGKPMVGNEEKQAVLNVLDNPTLVHGPRIQSFEKDFARFTGAKYAVAVSSCTAAMHLFYLSMGLQAGQEVIVPALTHTATAHAVEFCGARPVFVDAERSSGNIDIDQVEQRISSNCRGLSVVHFLGVPVDMVKIGDLAAKHNLEVLEDCALAIGSRLNNVHAGLHGDAGCFSFYPVKHITTAEGGMLITDQKKIAASVEKLRAFGVDRDVNQRAVPGIYDVTVLGLNYRMNEIQAAIGSEQIKRVGSFLRRRRENYAILQSKLTTIAEIDLFKDGSTDGENSCYCLSILLNGKLAKKRRQFVEHMKSRGIGTSVYYPRPVPLLSYYKGKYGYQPEDFPVSLWISESSVALPVGPHLNGEDMGYIAESIKSIIREMN